MNKTLENIEVEEENFAEMLEEQDNKNKKKIKDGVIVEMQGGTIFVDIGEKIEGVLPQREIENENFKKGDTIPVIIKGRTKKDEAILSYEMAVKELKRKEFLSKFKEGDVVKVKITDVNKGGFVAKNDDGVEFFIPKSESALKLEDDNIGKKVEAKIIEIKKNGAVLSRKTLLNEKREERNRFIETIKDKIVIAEIKALKKDGMIIAIGDWSGFVPADEVTYRKVSHFKLYKKGDKVEVKLIDSDKMLFSIKALEHDPWEDVAENGITNGDVLVVTVTNIMEYGAFVDIGNGVEGFLHISEISWANDKIEDVLKIGDEIEVEVTEIDLENRRLRVSRKLLLPKPSELFEKNHKEGDIVEGKVVNLTEIGGFIEVDNVVCFLPNRFVSWTKGEKAKDILEVGGIYKFKIISIDTENNKIILSKKDAEDSPYVAFSKEYKVGDKIKGKIKNIAEFGVFVSFSNGVEALVRKSDLEKEISEYKVDDELEGKIIELDVENKRVKLSQK